MRSRVAVVDAAIALLCESGAAAVTMEGVADRAGVAKTTLYRLFPNRAELLLATFERAKPEPIGGDHGDLRGDLIAIGRGLLAKLGTDVLSHAIPALVDEAERRPDLVPIAREHAAERRQHLVARLALATAAGELRRDVDPDLEATRFVGPIFYRRFFARVETDDRELAQLVDGFLAGIRPASASACESAAPAR